MKGLIQGFLIVLIMNGLTCACGLQAQEPDEQQTEPYQKARQDIDRLLAAHDRPGVPGVAIAVMKEGQTIFQKGYGLANLEYEVPVTPTTLFHVASVSKQFTVFSVLLLAESGRLSLDDDIREYVEEVPDFGHTITLRHLIHHTSGLRDQWDLLIMAGWRLDDVITQEHILRMISWQKELNFPPGKQYMYCNTGYTLLAEVVKRVSGQSFTDFTRDHIFTPLDMKYTFFCDDHEKIISNRAYSYYLSGGSYKKSVLNYANMGATGLYTTVEDLTKWVRNFDHPVIGGRRVFEQMRSRGTLSSGDTIDYAMGQIIGSYHHMQIIKHTGSDAGYKAYLGRIPEEDFALILLSNDAGFPETLMARKIIDVLIDHGQGDSSEKAASSDKSSPVCKKVPTAELEKYVGTYWNDKDLYRVDVRLRNDTLKLIWPGNVERPIIPTDKDTFRIQGLFSDIRVFFDHQRHPGKNLYIQIKEFETLMFTSHLQIPYTPESLDKYTGTYFSPELATWFKLEVKGESLVASHPRHGDIYLKAFGLDLFEGNRRVFGKVKFIRDINGPIKGCNISSPRARDIWFTKIAR